MEQVYIKDKTIEKFDFTTMPLKMGEYEGCTFINCNFSGADIADIKFFECVFEGCNLSNAKVQKTVLRGVQFKDCKMLGLRMDECNKFGFTVRFDNCALSHSSFYQKVLKSTLFRKTVLQEVDFTACDLSSAIFDECGLAGATFDNTNIEKADFRTAYNYSIDPDKNKLKKAKFSLTGISGLLDKYNIDIS